MKRRNFIKNISKLSSTPLLLNGIGVSPFITPDLLAMLNDCEGIEDRSVVVLFLKGGNDGLNTFIPIDQYSTYINHRPDIAIPESGANAYVNLDSTLDIADQVGIHPVMSSFKEMYELGKARIIQATGYPNTNGSHFKSSDNWHTGNDGVNVGSDAFYGGWIGRFFQHAYPNLYSNPTPNLDPLGIQIGDTKPSIAFHDCFNTYQAVNLTGQNPTAISGLLNGLGASPISNVPLTDHGKELEYIMSIENSASFYGTQITDVYNAGTNSNAVYPDSALAGYFSTVAQLLSGGSNTKIFQLSQDGFDTHSGQVSSANTTIGKHAELLENVFDCIKAFHEDLSNLGLGHKVVTLVFSEFSRRIIQNGSLGTDHGNVGPMLMFGDAINPGISGTNFDLTAIDVAGFMDENQLQHDYRSVFKSVLQDWMGAGDDILNPAFLSDFPILPNLFKTDQIVDPNCYISPTVLPVELKYFRAALNSNQQVVFEWETTKEWQVDYFEIERRKGNEDAKSIARTTAKGNNSNGETYQNVDKTPLVGFSYYRLKTVDLDSKISFSEWEVIELKNEGIRKVKIYPNPAVYDFNLVLTAEESQSMEMNIFNVMGQNIYAEKLNIKTGFNKFNVNVSNFKAGQYIVKIFDNKQEINSLNLIVIK